MTSLVQTRPGMMSWKVKAGLSTNWIFLNILLLEHLEPQTGDVLKHNCENGDVLKELWFASGFEAASWIPH